MIDRRDALALIAGIAAAPSVAGIKSTPTVAILLDSLISPFWQSSLEAMRLATEVRRHKGLMPEATVEDIALAALLLFSQRTTGFIRSNQLTSLIESLSKRQNAEFLAIAAAVLGGTGLFAGRGSRWAPIIGAILIIPVQNGLPMIMPTRMSIR